MSPEDALLGFAWAILFLVLACMAPRALRWRRDEEDESEGAETAFLDIGGPVIDAEPA